MKNEHVTSNKQMRNACYVKCRNTIYVTNISFLSIADMYDVRTQLFASLKLLANCNYMAHI